MNADGFWNDQEAAQKVIAEFKLLKTQVDPLEDVIARLEDVNVGLELAREADDRDLLEEADTDGDRQVSVTEFVGLAYDVLATLSRERAIMKAMDTADGY